MKSFDYRIAKNPAYWLVWFMAVMFLSAWAFATDVDTLYELYQVRDALSGTYVLTGNIDMEDTNPATKPTAYNAGTTYAIGDMCTHTHTDTERTYFSKTAGNVGNDPCDTDTTYWRVAWTTAEGWLPIGTSAAPFTGSFTGTGYTLSNMVIVRATTDYQGLFGKFTTGTLTGIGLVGGSVTGKSYTGFLAGYSSSTVASCYATGAVTGTQYTGGLVGYSMGTVTSCYATGAVEGTSYVGGLLGYSSGVVTGSYAQGVVTGSDQRVGGFVGNAYSNIITQCYATGAVSNAGSYTGGFGGLLNSTITKCYATGNVAGSSGTAFGGFAGYSWGDGGSKSITDCYARGSVTLTGTASNPGGFCGTNTSGATITNCYSTGAVTCPGSESGFCAFNSGTVTLCYWDTTTSGLGTSTAGTGFATAYMVTPYESGDDPPINPSKPYYTWGWGGNAWQTDPDSRNGGYPILGWQTPRAIIGH
jgi:hypothetical protein